MTESLREALRQAASDATVAGSQVTGHDLLRRARRRARVRTISGSAVGGLALVAALGIPLSWSLHSDAGDQTAKGDRSSAESSAAVGGDAPMMATELGVPCLVVNNYADWTAPVSAQNALHTAAVLLSPDGAHWASCVWDNHTGVATLYGDGDVEAVPGNHPRVGFWYDSCAKNNNPGSCSWGALGQISSDVAKMTFESADGRVSDAKIDDGFFAWQSTVDSLDVFRHPLWVTLYDADGNRIDRVDANPSADNW